MKTRLEWIDSLRGIAALAVAIMHLFEKLRNLYPNISAFKLNSFIGLLIEDFLNFGKIGVAVFFLISGFVVPFSLKNRNIKQFFVTRFFRLYPAYWFAIFTFLIILGMPPLMQLLGNLTMFQKFFGIQDLIGVFWTLQIEIAFYILCAILFYYGIIFNERILAKTYYSILLVTLILAIFRYFTNIKLPVALPLGLAIMFLGKIYRLYVLGEGAFSSKNILKFISTFVLFLLVICFLAYNKDYGFNEKWYKYFLSYIVALSIFLIFSKFKWHNSFFVFLGSISYSLYLLHPVFGIGLTDFVLLKYWADMNVYVYIILFLFFSFMSAAFCYFVIEKRAMVLGKQIVKRIKL